MNKNLEKSSKATEKGTESEDSIANKKGVS